MGKLTRRAFMIGGGAAAGALVLGVGFLSRVDIKGLESAVGEDGSIALNAWVEIKPDGRIILAIPRTEMGQGVHTSLPMLIAEELEIDLSAPNVHVVHPTENLPAYANFVLALRKRPEEIAGAKDWLGARVFSLVPFIGTGGSTSVVDAFLPLRRAGATARNLLLRAAAISRALPQNLLKAENGHIVTPDGDHIPYGDLAELAATLTPNEDIALKPASKFKLIGRDYPRLDIPAKVTGQAVFGIDAQPEGLLYAAIRQCPVFGGRVAALESAEASSMPGVVKVVNLGDAVAVVAETTWHAKRGAAALDVAWDTQGNERFSSQIISDMLDEALANGKIHVFEEHDFNTQPDGNEFSATYETPYLAHACMEPMNCTAQIKDGKAEIWASTQVPVGSIWAAEQNSDADDVTAHTMLAGGGFGRRSENDFAVLAVKVARELNGRPVKLVWSREEDIQHDMYRPAAKARMQVMVGADGMPAVLDYKIALQSVANAYGKRSLPIADPAASDPSNVEGAIDSPYAFPARRIAASVIEAPVPVGYWRSVGHSNNAFFMEGLVDELAVRASADPLAYRRRLLASHTRLTHICDRLEALSDWQRPLKPGEGRGIAIHPSFRSFVGQVVDVHVGDDKSVRVKRVTCVVDCGQTVNPDTIRAQMESGIIFALSAAMFGKITIEGGRVLEDNFPNYDMVRLAEVPDIHVEIVESNAPPGGVGEPGTPPLFPALVNAIHSATGERLRSLPLMDHGYSFA